MAIAACLALALLTFYGLVRERTLALNVAEAQTQNLARVLEEHTRQTLLRVHGRLVEVDRLLAGVPPTQAQLLALLPSDRLLGAIDIANANGEVMWSSRSALKKSLTNISGREYFLRHVRGADRELVFGELEQYTPAGPWALPVSRRITTPDGQFAGVIVASVLPSYFQAFYDSIDQEKHGFVTLFLSSGTAAVTSPPNESRYQPRLGAVAAVSTGTAQLAHGHRTPSRRHRGR